MPTVSPVLRWFIVLRQAVLNGDFERALEAQQALKQLGVEVRYGQPEKERR